MKKIAAICVVALLCSCSLFDTSTQIRFQNSSSSTFNGIKLGGEYDGMLAPGGSTDFYTVQSNNYTLMTKTGLGSWTPILDQYGNSFLYTLNSHMEYTMTVSDAVPGPGVVFTLSFVRD